MSERTEGSPEQLTSQKDFESADTRRPRAFDINRFRLFFTSEQRRRYEFARLRQNVHRAMTPLLIERRRINPTLTPEEAAVGVLTEAIEPQVRSAVFEFNRKGYKTTSSGFEGDKGSEYNPEYQHIQGHFFLDAETKTKLAEQDVLVTTDHSWMSQMKERMGLTSSDAPQEEKIITTIRFKPQRPDLKEIEATWKQIAATLPNKT